MAKSVNNNNSVDNIFAELMQQQNDVSPGSAVMGDEMFSTVKVWVPTGSSVMDTVISNKPEGGWPAGRTIELYGEESIGKSTLVFSSFASVQKQGGIGIYFDVEQAGSKEMMENCGVDIRRLLISNLTSIEDIFTVLEKNLTTIINNKNFKNKPVLVCVDSFAQMSTDAEIEGTYEHNMNVALKKAMQFGKAIRKITPLLNKANAALIIINQLRDKPGVTYGDPTCLDPYSTKVKIRYNKEIEGLLTEEISLAEFAERFVKTNDFTTPHIYNIEELDVEILGKDLVENKDVWEKVINFVVKPQVDHYYTDGILKGTGAHRLIESNEEIPLSAHPDFKREEGLMKVVDLSVNNIENYYTTDGRLSHNTTPGGNALKFAASVRIKLMGKTPVKVLDPVVEKMYEEAVLSWEVEKSTWEEGGRKGEKPVKPKKGDYKGDEIVIGYDIEAFTFKNKVGPPKRTAEFRIVFTEGIIEEAAWFDYSERFNIIEKKSAFEYIFSKESGIKLKDRDGNPLSFKKAEWFDLVISDFEAREKIKDLIIDRLVIKTKGSERIFAKIGEE